MKISVVIPTYHRPGLLLRCLDALSVQTFGTDSFEVVVVSDGPDTPTKELVSSFSASHAHLNILGLSTARKGGPAAARNLGWRNATGELIAFTDDDCIPDKEWLESFWEAYLLSNSKAIAFTGKTSVPIPNQPSDYERNISHLTTAEFITANCACTRSALQLVNGFDARFTMAWREDSDLHFKLLQNGIKIAKVSRALVTHPVRNHKWAISLKEEKKGIFNALLYKKYPRLYREKIESHPPLNYYFICLSGIAALYGLATGCKAFTLGGSAAWLLLTSAFIGKRLHHTKRTPSHVTEMVVTSALIPWLSLYYRWKGSLRYKVLLP